MPTFVRRLRWPVNGDVEISQILLMGNSVDTRNSGPYQSTITLRFLGCSGNSYGSAIRRSVSFTILFGNAAIFDPLEPYRDLILTAGRTVFGEG